MKAIFGIDPGPEKSGYVIIKGKEIMISGYCENDSLIELIKECSYDILVIEGVTSRKKVMGAETVTTCELSGFFAGIACGIGKPFEIIYRDKTNKRGIGSVRVSLCGKNNAKKGDVNKEVKKLLPGCWMNGKNHGPLFLKVAGKYQDHMLSAAAAALTYQRRYEK